MTLLLSLMSDAHIGMNHTETYFSMLSIEGEANDAKLTTGSCLTPPGARYRPVCVADEFLLGAFD